MALQYNDIKVEMMLTYTFNDMKYFQNDQISKIKIKIIKIIDKLIELGYNHTITS